MKYYLQRHRPAKPGSVFSSPKLLLAGVTTSNPFAMRSSPGRLSENSENHPASSCIIAPSKFGASASAASSAASHPQHSEGSDCNGSSSRPLLRPSLIGTGGGGGGGGGAASSAFQNHNSILKPAVLSNPFTNPVDVLDDDSLQTGTTTTSTSHQPPADAAKTGSSFLLPPRLKDPETAVEEGQVTSTSCSGSSTDSTTTAASSSNLFSIPSAPSSSFVFGQKLHERVANLNHGTSGSSTTASESFANGASPSDDNLFTVIAKKEKIEADSTSAGSGATGGSSLSPHASSSSNGLAAPTKTLNDSARELEESRASKRKYEEVAVVTGEEDEQNALQVYGKLFTFDKVQGTWVERGRGTLRLNDKQTDNQPLQSRLVMRTQGCLRVILNTKVWAEMAVDKTSSKSIRLTAVDGEQIRVFLLMASLKDTETLFNALEWRLATLRTQPPAARANPCDETSPTLTEAETTGASSPKRRSLSEADPDDANKKKRSD
nr:EOG090X078K [Polyphemus pediculus]